MVAEFAESLVEIVAEERNMDRKSVGVISIPGPSCWKVFIDGTANQRGSKVGLVLVFPKKTFIEKSLRLGFSAMNNKAEYKTLLRNGHGVENGRKSSRDVLGFEISSGLGKGRVGSQRHEDARVLEPS